MTSPAQRLASDLVDLRRQVRSLSRASQMNRRSIEGGSIPIYDADGTYKGSVGVQPDGGTGVVTQNDPTPPAPSAPILEPALGGLVITWDGTFAGGAARPSSFRTVEVHASSAGSYTPDETTHRVNLIGAGSVTISLPPDPYTVVFVAVTYGGSRSDPSAPATETPVVAPSSAEIDAARQQAADAQTAANAANAKALEAAGIAADKGKVVFANDPPAGDPLVLWIDLNDGNKPNRWNGSAWVPVQDASITSAQTKADQAVAAAADAAAKADGKVKTYFLPYAQRPTNLAAADDGDLLFDTADGNKMYRWNGTTSQWVATAYGASAIAATARQLGSITTYYTPTKPTSGMLTGDLWVDQANGNKLWRYDGTNWVTAQDTSIQAAATAASNANTAAGNALTAAQNAQSKADSAFTAAGTAQTTADGKNKVWWRPSTSAPPAPYVTGDLWFLTDLGNQPRRYSGTAWVDAQFADGAIANLNVGKLVSGSIAVGTTIYVGDPLSEHTEIKSDRIAVYAADPVDGKANEITNLGRYIGIRNPTSGDLVISLDNSGRISGAGLNITNSDDVSFGGKQLSSLLDQRAGGLSAWGMDQNNIVQGVDVNRKSISELAVDMIAGRRYKITWTGRLSVQFDNSEIKLTMRSDGTTGPTTDSAEVKAWYNTVGLASRWNDRTGIFTYKPATSGTYRFLLCAEMSLGSGTIGVDIDEIFVEDLGPDLPDTVVSRVTSGTTPPPPPINPKVTRTVDYFGNWSGSWMQSGARRNDVGSAMYQGNGDSFNLIQAGAWAWHDITGDLAGASVDRVELWLNCEWSWYTTGMTAQIGVHGSLNDPGAVWPGQRADWFSAHFGRNEGKWIDVSWWGNDIKSGAVRGITLYANTNDPTWYGRFTGLGASGPVPCLRVTFTK